MSLKLLLAGGKLLGLVGNDVQANARRERFDAEIATGKDGAVHKCIERDRFEADGRVLLSRDFKRGAGPPVVRQLERGLNINSAGIVTGWVKRDSVPLQIDHLRRGGDATLCCIRWCQVLELRLNPRRSVGNIDVKSKNVHRIAAPRKGMAVGGELHAGERGDWAAGRMIAREPLGIKQRQRPG